MNNDLIRRSAQVEKLFKMQQPQEGYLDMPEWESDKFRLWRNGVGSAIQIIKSAPAVDAVPVVRCRDCVHDGLPTCFTCYIEQHEMIFLNHDPEFFCGAGERKTE